MNPKSLIQLLEILLIELTEIHVIKPILSDLDIQSKETCVQIIDTKGK